MNRQAHEKSVCYSTKELLVRINPFKTRAAVNCDSSPAENHEYES